MKETKEHYLLIPTGACNFMRHRFGEPDTPGDRWLFVPFLLWGPRYGTGNWGMELL